MDFIDDLEYEHINQTTIDASVSNMPLVIFEQKFGAIDAEDSSCHGCFVTNFSFTDYTIQEDLNIDRLLIYSVEIFCEGTHFCPTNVKSHYYASSNIDNNRTIVSLWEVINGDVNVNIYGVDDVLSSCLKYITMRYFH